MARQRKEIRGGNESREIDVTALREVRGWPHRDDGDISRPAPPLRGYFSPVALRLSSKSTTSNTPTFLIASDDYFRRWMEIDIAVALPSRRTNTVPSRRSSRSLVPSYGVRETIRTSERLRFRRSDRENAMLSMGYRITAEKEPSFLSSSVESKTPGIGVIRRSKPSSMTDPRPGIRRNCGPAALLTVPEIPLSRRRHTRRFPSKLSRRQFSRDVYEHERPRDAIGIPAWEFLR